MRETENAIVSWNRNCLFWFWSSNNNTNELWRGNQFWGMILTATTDGGFRRKGWKIVRHRLWENVYRNNLSDDIYTCHVMPSQSCFWIRRQNVIRRFVVGSIKFWKILNWVDQSHITDADGNFLFSWKLFMCGWLFFTRDLHICLSCKILLIIHFFFCSLTHKYSPTDL